MNLYIVIFWEANDEPDTLYLVQAASHVSASDLVTRHTVDAIATPDSVCEIGISTMDMPGESIVYGPFRCTGYSYGRVWLRDGENRNIWVEKREA